MEPTNTKWIETQLSKFTDKQKDAIYRYLWSNHVRADILSFADDEDIKLTDEQVEDVIEMYVYGGQYDCNRSYWDNIECLIDEVKPRPKQNSPAPGKIYAIIGKIGTKVTNACSYFTRRGIIHLPVYTIRPKRSYETNGKPYFFITYPEMTAKAQDKQGFFRYYRKRIAGDECYGVQISSINDLEHKSYVVPVNSAGYEELLERYGENIIVPIYLESNETERMANMIAGINDPDDMIDLYDQYIQDEKDYTSIDLAALGIGLTTGYIVRYQTTEELERELDKILNDMEIRQLKNQES